MPLKLWETLKESGLALYYVASEIFGSSCQPQYQMITDSEEEEQPLPPVQLGEITEEELKAFDGTDPKKPLLMAIKGQIYDVSQGRMFYGPGMPYALFSGKEASRALAKLIFIKGEELTSNLTGLGEFELAVLQEWENKFMSKYVTVGTIGTAEATGLRNVM
ncbi:Membrane steroid-binding protein 2 [Heracleum sosnowskyi]|uniref:Membrane steroid-binding protein 2 n=1 Tax=Heracleum sosnowskyi TaxID=360622 RepID=A0AAD8IZ34_9APIA|nr:Membrane steroid-binding protein 2 [Heracleum sosnowskyi]